MRANGKDPQPRDAQAAGTEKPTAQGDKPEARSEHTILAILILPLALGMALLMALLTAIAILKRLGGRLLRRE